MKRVTNVLLPLVVLAVIVVVVLAAINKNSEQEKDEAVAVTVPVELTASGSVNGASLGVVLTVGDSTAEGSQWNQAASGAQVAVERFNRGGSKISLVTEDDHGSVEGARQAVERLAEKKVSGIILATSGTHISGALEAAQKAGIPVILPYQESSGGAWSLWASSADVADVVAKESAGSNRVFLINQAGHAEMGVSAEETLVYTPGSDANEFVKKIAEQTNSEAARSQQFTVVINADAFSSATLMRALQGSGVNANIIFGGEATSPAFSKSLSSDSDGSLAINASSVAVPFDDALALEPTAQGRSVSSYLQMVKLMSGSAEYTNVLGDQEFSLVADQADSRSHDAVVAFVRAIDAADSHSADAVAAELATLKLTSSDGVTGLGYDFSQLNSATDEVAILSPSQGGLDLRGGADGAKARLIWFSK